jgi:glycosyltransferase involved in cell wall biosynthesis
MNVWLVTIGEELPTDPGIRKGRTALMAESLLAAGHRVLWWTSAFDHFRKVWLFPEETEIALREGYVIRALKGTGYRKNISPARIIDHRVIARRFKAAAPGFPQPDVIVAALPSYDLALEAVRYGKARGIPVLVDLRDQWPDIFLDHVPALLKPIARLALATEFSIARRAMAGADGLVAMMPSVLEWGLSYAGRPRGPLDGVFYLGFERPSVQGQSEKIASLMAPYRDRFVVTFFGTFGYYHNPEILIRCAELLRDTDIHFVIAGDGEAMPEIRERAARLANVTLTGWLNQGEITTLLGCSHVGVCPTPRPADFFPNKAFVYLSAGLPIVSAFRGDLARFIAEHEVGFNYKPGDAASLAERLRNLHDSPDLRKRMSEKALQVYDTLLDAAKIYGEYTRHIERAAAVRGAKR